MVMTISVEIDIGVRILDTPIIFMAPLFVVKASQIGTTVKGCKTDNVLGKMQNVHLELGRELHVRGMDTLQYSDSIHGTAVCCKSEANWSNCKGMQDGQRAWEDAECASGVRQGITCAGNGHFTSHSRTNY
jgi:hypothetical protein